MRRKSRPKERSATRVLATIAALASASSALAQADPDFNADRAMERADELRQSAARRDNVRIQSAPAGRDIEVLVSDPTKPTVEPGRHFRNFAMDLAWSYNTNPGGANGDASWRFNPKAQLNTGFQTHRVLLYGSLTADLDRYPGNPSQHSQSITPYVSLELNNPKFHPDPNEPKKGKWKARSVVPYVFYSGNYGAPSTTGDFATRITDLGAALRARAGIDDWSVGMEVSAAKRYSSAGLNSQALSLKSSLTHAFNSEWSLSFSPSVRLRAFDADAAGNRRRDTTLATPLTLGYSREKNHWWEFSFSLAPTRNFSTSPAKENRQTDVGVMAHYVYTFDRPPSR